MITQRPVDDTALLEKIDYAKIDLWEKSFKNHQRETSKEIVTCKFINQVLSFHFYGDKACENAQCLREQFSFYLTNEPSTKIIDIFCAGGDEGNNNHTTWSNFEPIGLYIPRGDDFFLIQRDFILKTNDDYDYFQICAPQLILGGNTNTADNLVMMINAHLFPKDDCIILHAATVIKDDMAYVFFGDSGAGKSTLAEQCYNLEGQKVLSGDQIYLSLEEDGVWAHSSPTRVFEFPVGHPALFQGKKKVRAMTYLHQLGKFDFQNSNAIELMPLFMHETLTYLAPFTSNQEHFTLCSKILNHKTITTGKMSYPKGVSFWKNFEDNLLKG